MLFKTLASVLALAAASVNAQIGFTQPVAGTVWNAGSSAVIQWQGTNGASLNSYPITIELLYGPSGGVVSLGTLAIVKSSAGTVNVNVNNKLVNGNQYSLRANRTYYSDMFTIQGGQTSGNPDTVQLPAVTSTSDASKSSWSVLALGLAAGGAVMMA
jgi:hypothetical protein